MNRIDVEIALNRDRAWVLEQWSALSPEELLEPVTVSGDDPDFWWTPKDHFCHFVSVEKNFQKMVAAFLDGAADALDAAVPDRPRHDLAGMMNYVDKGNDLWVKRHRDKSMGELVRMGEQARAKTFELMATIDDDQFDVQIPGAPWDGGSIGAMLLVPLGSHGRTHWHWVTDGQEAVRGHHH
jgi:hypothetical protein